MDFFQRLYICIFQKQFLSLLSGSLCRRYKTTISLVNSPLLKKENYLGCLQRFSVIVTKHTLPESSRTQASLCSCCSVVKVESDSLLPRGLQCARLPCPSLSPGVCSDSCSLSQWCHPTISFSAAPSPPALNLSQHWGGFPM